ncbi:unnamed protein product [Lactuca saligna]|uniref:Uncharacterized protein n=1 Tax=Lactuca saligna TaxID=75948 RepID=A0AA35VAF8_LACSI|nr:unnamed protein product [Lactuca saligna]
MFHPLITVLNNYSSRGGKMVVEIVVVLRKKTSVVLKEDEEGFERLKLDKIYKEGWYVVFQAREQNDAEFQKSCFLLPDKHLYTTSSLEFILDLVKNSGATTRVTKSSSQK